MTTDNKEFTVNIILSYKYDYELNKIKEIIKQITDLEGIKKLEVNSK